MLRLHLLPANEGDCLWIEYGDPVAPRHVLIDTGTAGTYRALARRLKALPATARRLELFVVSHIDSDHIGAADHLLRRRPQGLVFGDIWFNGFDHLQMPADTMGERQAEIFSASLGSGGLPWNQAFGGAAVVVPEVGPLPQRELDGGLRLTLLSPYAAQLQALYPGWARYREALRARESEAAAAEPDRMGGEDTTRLDVRTLALSPFSEDDKAPNGSSIALLVEYEERRLLLAADSHPTVLERSVDRLLAAWGQTRLALDGFQVCHHGSRNNLSPSLAGKINAACWLVSTSGNRHHHPHPESIARLLYQRPQGHGVTDMVFNYRSGPSQLWDDRAFERRHDYRARYPAADSPGITWPLPEAEG